MTSLTDRDLRHVRTDGFVVIPDVVPEPLLAAADAEIDGLVETTAPHEGDGGPGVNAWFMPRARLPRCEALLRDSPALAAADELVAPGELDFAFDHVQVSTTRAPWHARPRRAAHRRSRSPPGSRTPRTRSRCSPASCSPTRPATESGNLWVWPGSHLAHQQLFRERGTRVLIDAYGHSTLLHPPFTLGPPAAGAGSAGRPGARPLPARPQQGRPHRTVRPADRLLPPRRPRSRLEVGRHVPRSVARVPARSPAGVGALSDVDGQPARRAAVAPARRPKKVPSPRRMPLT